jgi:AbiTii-like protein
MGSLVLDLQNEAINPDISTSNLLRKALIVAGKLKVKEFEEWISLELNGYPTGNIPEYRTLKGDVKGFNPYNGTWCPLIVEGNPELSRALSTQKTNQSIGEIEELIKYCSKNHKGILQLPYSEEIENNLMRLAEMPTPPKLIISPSILTGIIETVRNTVLNWALKMEEDGILGENLSFSSAEKKKAQTAEYHITNYFGNTSNSQIQVQCGTEASNQKIQQSNLNLEEVHRLLLALKGFLADMPSQVENMPDLKQEISLVETEIAQSHPDHKKVTEKLGSMKRILESAIGSAGGTGIQNMINWLASLIG